MNSIIITGATSGIGYECALQMAKMASKEQIILPARNIQKGNEVVSLIKKKTGHGNIKCLELDLASLKSIRQFSDNFSREKDNTISVLINNAGLQNIGETRYTKDKFEITFGTNHIGPFTLSQLLLPHMVNDGIITFTSSETHDPLLKTPIEPPIFTTVNELAFPKETSEKINIIGQRRYSTSKLCNIMTVYELQRRLNKTDIRVNAYDPGMTPGTGLAKSYSPMMRFLWNNIMPVLTLLKKNVHTPSQAGKNLASLAYSKKYKSLKGIYFSDGKVVKTSIDSYNKDYQKELWNGSLKLINMEFTDKTTVHKKAVGNNV